MKLTLKLSFSLILFFIYSFSFAQKLSQDKVQKLDQLLSKYSNETPGASLLITQGGQILYERYLGMADLENHIPVTAETIFEAGSVSKQFTAAALLMLAQEGKVSLDDEVQKYLPEVPVYQRPITLNHLLQHTSGLKDWGSLAALAGWERGSRVYTNDIALNYIIRQPDLNYLPGDEYLYSNSNYTLMTHIVERVSGQKLAEFTAQKMFKPLGMTKTSWRTDFRHVVEQRATGYESAGTGYLMNMPFENTYGHASLLTTVRDLDRWNTSWYQSDASSTLRDMRERTGVLSNGEPITYASGVIVEDHNGQKVVQHSGATAGYRAWLSYFPSSQISIVFLSNDANAKTGGIGEGAADIVLGPKQKNISISTASPSGAKNAITVSNKLIGNLVGSYWSDAVEGKWTIIHENDQLWVQVYPHVTKYKMNAISNDVFAVPGLGEVRLTHAKNKGSEISGFEVTVGRARNVIFNKIKN